MTERQRKALAMGLPKCPPPREMRDESEETETVLAGAA